MTTAYEVVPTTAEHIVGAVDAALLRSSGCTPDFAARLLDIPDTAAENALRMAAQLGLVQHTPPAGYVPTQPLSIYLVTARESQRAAVLRVALENYEPYRFFKDRLEVLSLAPHAADQAKTTFSLVEHRDTIKDTLLNLGTYTQSLVSEGAGLFKPAPFTTRNAPYIEVLQDVAVDRARSEGLVRRRLGDDVASGVSPTEVLSPLTTAYQKLVDKTDTKSPILYAGNAVEAFLQDLGTAQSVNLASATGINGKTDALARAGHVKTKHKNMLKYIGHCRNAADHGPDTEIGASWTITAETAAECVHVAMSTIRAVHRSQSGVFEL